MGRAISIRFTSWEKEDPVVLIQITTFPKAVICIEKQALIGAKTLQIVFGEIVHPLFFSLLISKKKLH